MLTLIYIDLYSMGTDLLNSNYFGVYVRWPWYLNKTSTIHR